LTAGLTAYTMMRYINRRSLLFFFTFSLVVALEIEIRLRKFHRKPFGLVVDTAVEVVFHSLSV